MVAWQPNWNDVDFDFAGAEQAIAHARRCRRVLEDRGSALAHPLAEARREWRGRKREVFDETEHRLEIQTVELIEEFTLAELHTLHSIDEAREEQARRVAERQRYFAEVEAEQRAQAIEAESRARELREQRESSAHTDDALSSPANDDHP